MTFSGIHTLLDCRKPAEKITSILSFRKIILHTFYTVKYTKNHQQTINRLFKNQMFMEETKQTSLQELES